MNITKQTIEHMAYLARLPIEADDAQCADMLAIMEYMATVTRSEVTDKPPVLHSVLREDELGVCLPVDDLDLDAFHLPKTVE